MYSTKFVRYLFKIQISFMCECVFFEVKCRFFFCYSLLSLYIYFFITVSGMKRIYYKVILVSVCANSIIYYLTLNVNDSLQQRTHTFFFLSFSNRLLRLLPYTFVGVYFYGDQIFGGGCCCCKFVFIILRSNLRSRE